jgi:hypothetical protein
MNIEFETPDLERSIQELSTYSAPGPDGVPAVLLKKMCRSTKGPSDFALENIERRKCSK